MPPAQRLLPLALLGLWLALAAAPGAQEAKGAAPAPTAASPSLPPATQLLPAHLLPPPFPAAATVWVPPTADLTSRSESSAEPADAYQVGAATRRLALHTIAPVPARLLTAAASPL